MLPVQFDKDRARPCAGRDRHTDTTGRHKHRGRHRVRLILQTDRRHREHELRDANLNLLLFKWLTPMGSAFYSFVQHQCLVGTQSALWMRLVHAEECCLLLSPHSLLSVPSSTSLKCLHKDSTIHSRMDPLTSVKKMLHTFAHRPIWWWQLLKWRTLFPAHYNFVKLIRTNHHDI